MVIRDTYYMGYRIAEMRDGEFKIYQGINHLATRQNRQDAQFFIELREL